jgi:hypothetical protein
MDRGVRIIRSALGVLGSFAALAVLLVLAAPAGATPVFLSAINLSDPGQDGFEPQVAVDSSGNSLTVWTRSDGTNLRIQALMRTPSGSFGPIDNISDAGQNSSEPQVAFDASGNAIAVWSQSQGANTRIEAAFRPAGGSFGAPVAISAAGGSASNPHVSFDSSGAAVAVWERFDGTNLRIQAATRPPSGSFGPAQTLSGAGQDAFDPEAAAGPAIDANAVAVWTRSDGTKLRVQSSRRRDVPGFVRPKSASPFRTSLVPAYNACAPASANRTHGPSLAFASCNPPAMNSNVLTVGTPDVNGFVANSVSFVRLDAVLGDVLTDADEADVRVQVSMTDIRNNPSGTDYAGRVLFRAVFQTTDHNNAAETPEPATGSGPVELPIDCVTTPSTTTGGVCSLSTTLDAVLGNAVVERLRQNWELGQVEIKDAGPNGTGYGAGCPPTCGDGDETVFMREGVFIP